MKFIILTFLIVVLTLPSRVFAALDYGKQSLVGADFSGTDLKGATFYLTDLQDANLSGCEPVSYTHLTLPTNLCV